jgi:hypothetical protein
MFGQETVWGTGVTPTRALEFNSETIKKDVTWLEPNALRAGTKYKRASRIRQSRTAISGDFSFDVNTLGMGMLVKNMLASSVTTTTLVSGTAYKQVHVPGDFRGQGLTVQVGRPEASSGLVKPFTFAGCKISKWEFSLKDNDTPNLKLTVDGRSESTATALAAATYLAGATTFDFSQATLKLGGTVATTAGETAITGGTAVATIVKDILITGTAPMDVARYGLGNAGQKAEQLENGIPTITGRMTAEFNQAELYALFANNTTTALQLDLTGAAIGASNALFSFVIPAIKVKTAPPNVSGPAIVQMSTNFEVYSDEVNPVIQVKIVSTESTTI